MLETSDLSTEKKRKLLSDWSYMMKKLEEALGEDSDLDPSELDERRVRTQYLLARNRLPVALKVKRGRPEEWKVVTAVKETRRAFKIRRTEAARDVGEGQAGGDVEGDVEPLDALIDAALNSDHEPSTAY
jgi:hypothetical protein